MHFVLTGSISKKRSCWRKTKGEEKRQKKDEERGFDAMFKYLMMICFFVEFIQIHYPEEEGKPSKYRGEILMYSIYIRKKG